MTKLTKQEIENLIENADFVHWYEINVFQYKKDGYWTLIQDDKVLVENVNCVYWYKKNTFRYYKDGKWKQIINTEVKND